MDDPRIAFTSTCKGRLSHLYETLSQNLADNASYPNAVFVVLAYGDPEVWEWARDTMVAHLASGRLVVYSYSTSGSFEVAHAKNMAARCAMREGADVLVTLDADNFTGPCFAEFIASHFPADSPNSRPGIFLCPDFDHIKALPHGPERPQRGYAGRLAIQAQTFLKMGGYDEFYDVWRGEDMDMIFRLTRAGYARHHIPNQYLSTIPHGAEVRFQEYPHAQAYETKQEYQAIKSRAETVVNNGRWGLGAVLRNGGDDQHPHPIELTPIPTRIFGIGLQRTGTTSLDSAFRILGFDSFHWGSGEAPIIWQEMNQTGRSKTLEQWYAFSDNPIPLLYKKLDRAYPGSKFILTTLGEENWIQSVERLWSFDHNPNRWMWEKYPFTHRIHTVLYGQKEFDREIFLARYRRHNAEVREYFRNRPGDLLEINPERGDGWLQLCLFLDVPVPKAPYPHKDFMKPESNEADAAAADEARALLFS